LKGEHVIEEKSDISALQSVKTNPNKPDTYNNPTQVGSEKLDLSFLLNILDGVLEIPGRIVIMTSNYIDKLDHALIRPGRIDIIANFKKCMNKTLIEMMEFFYDISLTEKDKNRILNLREYIVSPAEMGKVMFENFDDFRKAIDTLEKICEETEKKEQKSTIYRPVIEETEKKEQKSTIYTPVIEETEKKEQKSTIYTPVMKNNNKKENYSITSTNKAYGENDSLEIFDHTNVFSSGVSVF